MVTARRQLAFRFQTWGGARQGAGRPPKGGSAGVCHVRRPALSQHHPVHVTLRVVDGLPSLRAGAIFGQVRGALAGGRARFGFRLVHFSVQSNHLHLIAEARDRLALALARGMQGLCIRVARAANGAIGRSGRLFADRYHARALKTPRQVRFALRYVLLNAKKHARAPQGSAGAPVKRRTTASRAPLAGFVDACSSAPWFAGFARPSELVFGARSARWAWEQASNGDEPPVAAPRTWLLRIGWKRAGPFDTDDVPGGH